MTTKTDINVSRVAGALLGVGLAALLLIAARPGASPVDPTGSVRLIVPQTGELEVSPAQEPALEQDSLRPGGPAAEGSFTVRNQTGETLSVSFRAKGGSTALDGALRVRLDAPGANLSDGTLQALRAGSAAISLPSGATAQLRLEAWIPAEIAQGGFLGGAVNAKLVPVIAVAS